MLLAGRLAVAYPSKFEADEAIAVVSASPFARRIGLIICAQRRW